MEVFQKIEDVPLPCTVHADEEEKPPGALVPRRPVETLTRQDACNPDDPPRLASI